MLIKVMEFEPDRRGYHRSHSSIDNPSHNPLNLYMPLCEVSNSPGDKILRSAVCTGYHSCALIFLAEGYVIPR